MSDDLSQFPEILRDTEIYPWDRPEPTEERYVWLWGLDKGKALEDIDSRELVRKRAWLESKSGPGRAYGGLIAEIDRVLTARAGE